LIQKDKNIKENEDLNRNLLIKSLKKQLKLMKELEEK
jgi:hypothetical protein